MEVADNSVDSVGEARFTVRSSQELVAGRLSALFGVYTAWKLKVPTELVSPGPKLPVVGTNPFVTVSVAESIGVPVQEPPGYIVNVTLPPAVVVTPVSVAVSVTTPDTVMVEDESIVVITEGKEATVRNSLQGLVAGMLLPSPV